MIINDEELSEFLNDDLKINISSLESEWEKHALLYYKWSNLFVECQLEKNEARLKLNIIEARIDIDVRCNPQKYNLGRITEAAVKSVIYTSEEYIKANLNYFNLEKRASLLNAAVKSIEYKNNALENLK